jgi:defect-in-organelle-trafficking protein DotD
MQKQRPLLLLSILFFMFAMSGCTVLKKSEVECDVPDVSCEPCRVPPQIDCPKLNVEEQLLGAAQSIEESLNTLAAAQKAESQPILNTAPLVTPEGGMGGTIDIDWTGPIGPLVDKIARLTDYRVKFLGTEPPIPILVAVTAKHAIIAEVLQNASLQAKKRAQILVFPDNHVIEVRYLS